MKKPTKPRKVSEILEDDLTTLADGWTLDQLMKYLARTMQSHPDAMIDVQYPGLDDDYKEMKIIDKTTPEKFAKAMAQYEKDLIAWKRFRAQQLLEEADAQEKELG